MICVPYVYDAGKIGIRFGERVVLGIIRVSIEDREDKVDVHHVLARVMTIMQARGRKSGVLVIRCKIGSEAPVDGTVVYAVQGPDLAGWLVKINHNTRLILGGRRDAPRNRDCQKHRQ